MSIDLVYSVFTAVKSIQGSLEGSSDTFYDNTEAGELLKAEDTILEGRLASVLSPQSSTKPT